MLGIALSDLAKGLVLVTALLDVLSMENILLCLLGVIPHAGQFRGKSLKKKREET